MNEPYAKRALEVALVELSRHMTPKQYTEFRRFYNNNPLRTLLSEAIIKTVSGYTVDYVFNGDGDMVEFPRLSQPKNLVLQAACLKFNTENDGILKKLENYFEKHPKDPYTGHDLAPLKPSEGDRILPVTKRSDLTLFELVRLKGSPRGVFHRYVGSDARHCIVYGVLDDEGGTYRISSAPPAGNMVDFHDITHHVVSNYTLSVVAQQIAHGKKNGPSIGSEMPTDVSGKIFGFLGVDARLVSTLDNEGGKGSLRKGGRRTKRNLRRSRLN